MIPGLVVGESFRLYKPHQSDCGGNPVISLPVDQHFTVSIKTVIDIVINLIEMSSQIVALVIFDLKLAVEKPCTFLAHRRT